MKINWIHLILVLLIVGLGFLLFQEKQNNNSKINTLEKRNDSLTSLNKSLKSNLDSSELRIRSLKEDLDKTKERIDSINQDYSVLYGKYEKAKDDILQATDTQKIKFLREILN